METIVYTALILLLAHLALGVILWLRVRKLYSYPGLLGFPVIGNLYYFYRTMFIYSTDSGYRYVTAISEGYEKSGILFHWIAGYNIAVAISNPALVKKLAFHPDVSDRPFSMYGGFTVYFNGPFSRLCSDDLWRIMRKEHNICLKKSRINSDYFNSFIKCADKMVDTMLASPFDVDIHAVSTALAYDASLKTLFGIETSLVHHPDVVRGLEKLGIVASISGSNSLIAKSISFILDPFLNFIIGKTAELRKLILEETKNKLRSNQFSLQEPHLSISMASRSIKHDENDKALLKELQELLASSGHTVSTTLADTINLLAMLPDIQERAWQEQYQIFGNDSRDPTIEDINQMQFLDRVIKESYRFLGPPLVGKKVNADINIDGIIIPRNTVVIYMLRNIKFNPEYIKNPNTFDPDRFLEENEFVNYFSSPFGIGIRNCPGMHFGTTLIKIVLSKMLRRIKIKAVKKDLRFEQLKYKAYIMITLENPPKLQIEERL